MRVFFVLIFLFPFVYFTQSRSLLNFTDYSIEIVDRIFEYIADFNGRF